MSGFALRHLLCLTDPPDELCGFNSSKIIRQVFKRGHFVVDFPFLSKASGVVIVIYVNISLIKFSNTFLVTESLTCAFVCGGLPTTRVLGFPGRMFFVEKSRFVVVFGLLHSQLHQQFFLYPSTFPLP